MASLTDPDVRQLLEKPHHAVISTVGPDNSLHSAVVWVDLDGDELSVNSAVGRRWPTNLERDHRISLVVYPPDNPYEYVEVRGTADGTTDGADEHINRLAKKYLGQDEYPFRQPGEQRIKYTITPATVRHQKQG